MSDTQAVRLRWRVMNEDGLCWWWDTHTQAEAQLSLWEKQGDTGTVAPSFWREGVEITEAELANWVAAANRAMPSPSQDTEFKRPEKWFPNKSDFVDVPTDSFLRNGYIVTKSVGVEQYFPGGEITLWIENSRGHAASGFIRMHPETLIHLAGWVVANQGKLIDVRAELRWEVTHENRFPSRYSTRAEAAAMVDNDEVPIRPVLRMGGYTLAGEGLERWVKMAAALVPEPLVQLQWYVKSEAGLVIAVGNTYERCSRMAKRKKGTVVPVFWVGSGPACDDTLTEWVTRVNDALQKDGADGREG